MSIEPLNEEAALELARALSDDAARLKREADQLYEDWRQANRLAVHAEVSADQAWDRHRRLRRERLGIEP